MKLHTYLNFDGTTEEAFTFYKSAFGLENMFIQYMKDTPEADKLPAEEQNRVMHASIEVSPGHILMGTDILPSAGHTLNMGNNTFISIQTDTREEADRIFAALSEGGTVDMPLADMFWGDYFGSLEDKFGVQWMVNCATKRQ